MHIRSLFLFLITFVIVFCEKSKKTFDGVIDAESCEKQNAFFCSNGENCIPLDWLTDGESDCADGSDESAAAAEYLEKKQSISPLPPHFKEVPVSTPLEVKPFYRNLLLDKKYSNKKIK